MNKIILLLGVVTTLVVLCSGKPLTGDWKTRADTFEGEHKIWDKKNGNYNGNENGKGQLLYKSLRLTDI